MAEEKKIIVDEDWKSQVEREKEEALKEAETHDAGAASPQGLPPASFEMLVTTFASEAMVALGQVPNPFTNEYTINFEHARYTIDMLDVLQQKTKGNLTADEASMLETLIHQLRLAYVTLQNEVAFQATSSSPIVEP